MDNRQEVALLVVIAASGCIGYVKGEIDERHKQALEIIRNVQTHQEDCVPHAGALPVEFDHEKWDDIAKIAVRTANIVTQLLVDHENSLLLSMREFLYDLVISTVRNDDVRIYGSAVLFEEYVYPEYRYFAPYAYRKDKIYSHDFSVEYIYSGTEWFSSLKDKSWDGIHFSTIEIKSRWNDTSHSPALIRRVPEVRLEDGYWTKPFFDCGGGDCWMVLYSAPIFGLNKNNHPLFKGVATIEINLSNIDINQCDAEDELHESIEEFRGTHHCQPTTECIAIKGEGFALGSYTCQCMSGFYFPEANSSSGFYSGKVLEQYFGDDLASPTKGGISVHPDSRGSGSGSNTGAEPIEGEKYHFQCLKCPTGCQRCEDGSTCEEWSSAGDVQHACLHTCVLVAFSLLLF